MQRFVRAGAHYAARHGDPQGRFATDPAVRAHPIPFYEELRARGPLVRARVSFLTVDHALAHELLRSDDFRVIVAGKALPPPLRWLERHTRADTLHPLLPPSLLAVEPPEHTRYRKTVSSVFTSRAVTAPARPGGGHRRRTPRRTLRRQRVVDIVEQYCSQPRLRSSARSSGVPCRGPGQVLEFGELAAPSLDFGLSWRQYQSVRSWPRRLQQLARSAPSAAAEQPR